MKSHYKWCRLLDDCLEYAKGDSEYNKKRTKELLYELEHYWDSEKEKE